VSTTPADPKWPPATSPTTPATPSKSDPPDPNQINPIAVQAMAEDGIDITTETPKILTTEAVQASDVVITMGCGDTCPYYPGKRYEDWTLDDPAGQSIEAVRPIRNEIKQRILNLLDQLAIPPTGSGARGSVLIGAVAR
jgi:hypothetical protein